MSFFSRLLGLALALALLAAVASAQTPSPTPSIPTDSLNEIADDLVQFSIGAAEITISTLQGFLDRLTQVPRSDVVRLVLIAGGVLLLIAGWRVYDFVVLIAGALIGAAAAGALFATDDLSASLLIMGVGALIGAFLSVSVYYLAAFLIGAYIGIVLTSSVIGTFTDVPIEPLVLLIAGLVGGILMIGLSFQFAIILAALVGAQMLVIGLNLSNSWLIFLAIGSILLQFFLARRFGYEFRRTGRRPLNPFRRRG